MHTDFTALQMKITKKESISTAFQRLLRSFLVRNTMAVDLWNTSGRYLQRPSLTINSMLKLSSHDEGNNPIAANVGGGGEGKKPAIIPILLVHHCFMLA